MGKKLEKKINTTKHKAITGKWHGCHFPVTEMGKKKLIQQSIRPLQGNGMDAISKKNRHVRATDK